MICINCFASKTSTINSRAHKTSPKVWRRHRCTACRVTFTSYETVDVSELITISSNGTSQPLLPGKLLLSVAAAFGHAPAVRDQKLYFLLETVKDKLLLEVGADITLERLKIITWDVLHHFDPAAGVQYAAAHNMLGANGRVRLFSSSPGHRS